jgi:hypothetical protein
MQSRTGAQGLTPTQVRSGIALLFALTIRQFVQDAPKLFLKIWNRQNPAVTITGATNATPIVVTAVAHGFANGDLIAITGMVGATGGNGVWEIANKADDTFELKGSAAGGVWSSGGTAYAQPDIIVPILAGETHRDAQQLKAEFQGTKGGAYCSAGLSYAVSASFGLMTAPDAGDEPEVILDYNEVG